ncbi:MAG: hypothetical protein R2932_33265 [Caldilineaceae bacterium]
MNHKSYLSFACWSIVKCSIGVIILAIWIWRYATPPSVIAMPLPQAESSCGAQLPTIEWLGEGAGTYSLGNDFDTFIVKPRPPFRFITESGMPNAQGERVYQARTGERVWRCAGNCQLPAVYHDAFDLGLLNAGTTVNLVVIDDDIDDRRNWWARSDPLDPYLLVEEQQFVEYLTLELPETGNWYYYAQDSIELPPFALMPLRQRQHPRPQQRQP